MSVLDQYYPFGLVPQSPEGEAAAGQSRLQDLVARAKSWGQGGYQPIEQQGNTGIAGKALGMLGLDDSGARAATTWPQALQHTAYGLSVPNLAHTVADTLGGSLDRSKYATMGGGVSRGEDDQMGPLGLMAASMAPMGGMLAKQVAPGVAREAGGAAEVQTVRDHGFSAGAERPMRAALNIGGHIFEGPTHSHALIAAEDALGHDRVWSHWNQETGFGDGDGGFVTNKGRYVSRKEASALIGDYDTTTGLHSARLDPKTGARAKSGTENRLQSVKLLANGDEAALPGLVLNGYRGYNPDKGIGPAPGKPQAVWATPDNSTAEAFAFRRGDNQPGAVSPVEMRFNNPAVVDAKGANFDNIPVRDSGLLGLLKPTMRYDADGLALAKKAQGHDGLHIKNVREVADDGSHRTADQYVALQRGTVYDPTSGNLLWSNPDEAAPLAGITAYHGSPHDFDKFSMGKIGTGEGAQAYGHGLYFAENEATAKNYRDVLGPKQGPKARYYLDGKVIPDSELGNLSWRQQNELETRYETNPGHMYEVRINADPKHFLQADKPLGEQSPYVQEKIAQHGLSPTEADLGSWGGQPVRGSPRWADNASEAAKLNDAGIPGIRYLDQGSRGAGQGSHNYVAFDDKIIEIVRKYGWAAAAPLIAKLSQQGEPQ